MMDNYYITKPPFGKTKSNSNFLRFINKGFRYIKMPFVVTAIDTTVDMNTVEQRINYYHLLNHILLNNIEGEVVELGCFTGQCSMLFQKIIQDRKSDKELHLFDSFEIKFTEKGNLEEKLIQNFKNANLETPILHKGFFENTLHSNLPEKLSFVHIDCGFGGSIEEHKKILLYCLNQIYGKMSKGAVCILMDYMYDAVHGKMHNPNPAVKPAVDEFLSDKPEEIVSLYGNQYVHAYFMKE